MSTKSLEVKIGVRVRIEKLHKMKETLQQRIVQMRVLEAEVEKLANTARKLLPIRRNLRAESSGGKRRGGTGNFVAEATGIMDGPNPEYDGWKNEGRGDNGEEGKEYSSGELTKNHLISTGAYKIYGGGNVSVHEGKIA